MKITKSRRETIAKAHNIISVIKEKLKQKDAEIKNSVDLSKIASNLADRREKNIKLNK